MRPEQSKAEQSKAAKAGKRTDEASARQRLLAAAHELFYREGIRSVGIDEIIAAADVAKMSLYRSFASKDELVAAYLRERDALYWQWWDDVMARHPDDPRERILGLFRALAKLPARPGWRGCPFTNAATEFPARDHPARLVAEANKRELRKRLRVLAKAVGAHDAESLGDQLVLLFEGVYSSAPTFGATSPASRVAAAAEAVLAAQCG